jgi:hypothetical protein
VPLNRKGVRLDLIAKLGLTSNRSAASRREAPDSTASTTARVTLKNTASESIRLQKSNQRRQIRSSKHLGEFRFNTAEIDSNSTSSGAIPAGNPDRLLPYDSLWGSALSSSATNPRPS